MKHRNARARAKPGRAVAVAIALVAGAAIVAGTVWFNRSADPQGPLPVHLPTTPQSYLGVYLSGLPDSPYSQVNAFSRAAGVRPDLVMYYSGWFVPFPTRFAEAAAANGAVPLVQMDPDGISVAAIAHGQYDGYLSSFAESVRAYQHPVILSFGHEMNGSWYSWGFGHTSPGTFIAAWRHIVTIFRALGAHNVTWLWTVNIINDTQRGTIPRPSPWWPGRQYVTWVGIDGYYLKSAWSFAPLFGPTIAAVHMLTQDPILIAETGAVPAAGQPAKIRNLFAGVRAYGLLGFVWFDASNSGHLDFRISGSAALAAFRSGGATFSRPGS